MIAIARVVLDSSVVIAGVQPAEPDHAPARDFVARLREAVTTGTCEAFAPPELWLEVHVVEQRLARSRRGPPALGPALEGLQVELVTAEGATEMEAFLEELTRRMRGRRPLSNATDLVYLWAAWRVEATVVSLDQGMLAHHGLVCDVTAPQHARLAGGGR